MHMKKLHIFPKFVSVFALVPLMLAVSCGAAPSSGDETSITPTPAAVLSPGAEDSGTMALPSTTPTPFVTPTPISGAYTPEAAAEQIRAFLDSEHYEISLVSDDLCIDSENYYTFLISLKGSAMEPLVLVNKKDGGLKCILADNTIQEITVHPLYQDAGDTAISWNGTYVVMNEDGSLRSYIIMEQIDDGHFEFTAYSYLDYKVEELSGVAQISGNEASFAGDTGSALSFSWSGANLVLNHSHPAQSAYLTGIYSYTEDQDSRVVTATPQEVLERLSKLNAAQTGLAGDMQDYLFYLQDDITIMNDRLCYNVLVYSNQGHRLYYQAQFFITLDGSTVYSQGRTPDDIQIFSLQ